MRYLHVLHRICLPSVELGVFMVDPEDEFGKFDTIYGRVLS